MSNWKLSRWNYLYVQLLLLLIFMLSASFIPEYCREFFGDWKCEGREEPWNNEYKKYVAIGCNYIADEHIPTWHWGYRHWLFSLFSIVFTIVFINRISDGWERREP